MNIFHVTLSLNPLPREGDVLRTPRRACYVTPSLNPSPRGRDLLRHFRDGKKVFRVC